jgi:heavy metal sensor kinase
MRPRIRSIRVRVTLWYLGILMATLGAFGLVVYLALGRSLRAEVDHVLEVMASQAVDVSSRGRVELDVDKLPAGYIATVRGPNGEVLGTSPQGATPLPWDASLRGPAAEGRATWRSVSLMDQSWRVHTRPVLTRGSLVAVVEIARSEESVEDALDQLGTVLMALTPVALIVAGGVGWFLAGRALEPIDRITRTAAAISAADLARRLPEDVAKTPDEVGRLAATFNSMLERLEGAFKRQRQFTADASHELRTPLTLLRTQLDVTLARPRGTDEYERALRGMREDVTTLQRLVTALLTLARADAGQDPVERQWIDLSNLAHQVVAEMRELTDRRVELVAETQPGVTVYGDEARLTRLMVNLVENAIAHTPAGGRVTVATATAAGDSASVLAVRDTGIGIAAEHLPHLFERFYRVDPARSSAGGAGLGLAISKSIVEEHGGRIEVASRPGAGSTFTVTLPRASAGADLSRPAVTKRT